MAILADHYQDLKDMGTIALVLFGILIVVIGMGKAITSTLWWWKRKLRSKDPSVRMRAVERLGNFRRAGVVKPLIGMLTDDYLPVRIAAVQALGKRGDHRAIVPLVAALGDRQSHVRNAAARVLKELGWEANSPQETFLFALAMSDWRFLLSQGADGAEFISDRHQWLGFDERRKLLDAFGKMLTDELATVLPFLTAASRGEDRLEFTSNSSSKLAEISLAASPDLRSELEDSLDRKIGRERRTQLQRERCERRPGGHDWKGCICCRCLVTKEANESGHDWGGCVCRACGAKRDEQHQWNGCICTRCSTRHPFDAEGVHDWGDGCICARCGTVWPADAQGRHDWEGCRCRKCGHENHTWTYYHPPGRTDYRQEQCTKCGQLSSPEWIDY